MSRAASLTRVWRRSPNALVPPGLALAGVLAAAVCEARAPSLGRAPYAVPWIALLSWLVLGLQPLARYAPKPRALRPGEEPVAAALLFRWPLGAAVLGCVVMAAYDLAVGAMFGDASLTTAPAAEIAARVYAVALEGVAGGLMIWELVVGAEARRVRAGERRRA